MAYAAVIQKRKQHYSAEDNILQRYVDETCNHCLLEFLDGLNLHRILLLL